MAPHHYHKTRIAPTPSGYLHLGNVLSFAITAALAKKSNAKIVLRIDDLDRARAQMEYVQDIFDTLHFLAIPWDEGAQHTEDFEADYSQLHRMPMYLDALEKLHDKKLVFACTCSRKTYIGECRCRDKHIPLATENAAWRLITDDTGLVVNVYNSQPINAVLPADMQNFVVKKKDGYPAYQLTSVVDDLFYGVDLVVRGEDLWASTLAQHQLAIALGADDFSRITFYHHPLLMEEHGSKLSKSAGATSVRYLRENGNSPADIYTLIAAMLGIDAPVSSWEQLTQAII